VQFITGPKLEFVLQNSDWFAKNSTRPCTKPLLLWAIETDLFDLISMQLYLLGAVLFVTHLRRQLFVVQHSAKDVGDFARYLYAKSLPFKKVRHPRIGSFTVPGHKVVFGLLRFLTWFPRIGPRVRDKFGVGMWQQFRDLCVVTFRHRLDAQVYYMFELYRREHRARASGYLTRYEMKNGLYKALTLQVSKTRHRIMLGALNAHGTMDVGLPAGPPLFRFADPQECAALFAGAGLADMTFSKLQLRLDVPAPDGLFDAFTAGAVRVAIILARQSPEALAKVREAVRAASAEYGRDGMLGIPMTSVLVSGRKP